MFMWLVHPKCDPKLAQERREAVVVVSVVSVVAVAGVGRDKR